MTEEIIIDGVNVAGCDGLNKNSLPLKQCDLLQFKTKDGGIAGRWCTDHSNCYYKQLKRLEQENKELQAYKDINEDFKKAWDELNEKYKQLRSALEEIRDCLKDWDNDVYNPKELTDKINEVLQDKENKNV
jgi:flagellar biosynthesis/type III secretory pathway chaperone